MTLLEQHARRPLLVVHSVGLAVQDTFGALPAVLRMAGALDCFAFRATDTSRQIPLCRKLTAALSACK
jgi:hypothetical protein